MHMRTWGIWALVVAALCALAALSWWWAVGSQSRVDPEFTQAFVDLNRRLDDHATAVAYDPQSKILAVGRNSGPLELWDDRRSDSSSEQWRAGKECVTTCRSRGWQYHEK